MQSLLQNGHQPLTKEIPETVIPSKEPFILSFIVGGFFPGKVHLDDVLQVLPEGGNKKHASLGTL